MSLCIYLQIDWFQVQLNLLEYCHRCQRQRSLCLIHHYHKFTQIYTGVTEISVTQKDIPFYASKNWNKARGWCNADIWRGFFFSCHDQNTMLPDAFQEQLQLSSLSCQVVSGIGEFSGHRTKAEMYPTGIQDSWILSRKLRQIFSDECCKYVLLPILYQLVHVIN